MRRTIAAIVFVAGFAAAPALEASEPAAKIEVSPREATVGAHLTATVRVEVPEGTDVAMAELGATLGPFEILSGSWRGPEVTESTKIFTWEGVLAAYETGELEVPSVGVEVTGPGGSDRIETEPVAVTVRSVLPPDLGEEESRKIADLKPAVSIEPDFGPLKVALGALVFLLAMAGVAWWLHRRYAARLEAVPVPEDPFRRTPPHVWVYAELQGLLDARLAEDGHVDRFFEELARILKTYLSGRYRIDLMERTTEEVSPLLGPAGVPAGPGRITRSVLELCDRVKFARDLPESSACRGAVDEVYRIVDATKPRERTATEDRGAA